MSRRKRETQKLHPTGARPFQGRQRARLAARGLARVNIARATMMKIAFAGSFAIRLAEPVRARLSIPCEVIADDEAGILPKLADVDVLVSMGFTKQMAGRSSAPIDPGTGSEPRSDRPQCVLAGLALGERLRP